MDVAAVWTRFTQEERATLEPLRYAPFRRALTARIVSSAGSSWMQAVAAGWLMFELTRSAVAVGVLTLLSRAPGMTWIQHDSPPELKSRTLGLFCAGSWPRCRSGRWSSA